MNRVLDLAKSRFRYVVHLYNIRGHHKAADSYFHGLGHGLVEMTRVIATSRRRTKR